MKATLTRWAGWFTDARRQALQALVASTVSLLVILGAVSDVQSSALLDLSASGLLAVQGALGLILLRAGDRFTWLNTTGRGLIYSLGGAIGVAGIAFSLWSESTSGLIVQVATVLASILVGAVQMVNAGTLSGWPDGGPVDDDRLATVAESRAAEQADAGRSIESSPATFAREKDPGLRVGIFAPQVVGFAETIALQERAVEHFPERVSRVFTSRSALGLRGLSFDVMLVTEPLTRALIETFEPNVASSTYEGQRVQEFA